MHLRVARFVIASEEHPLVHPLPPLLCEIVDALAFSEESEGLAQDWEDWVEDFQSFYDEQSDHSLSEADQRRLAEIPVLLGDLRKLVELALVGETHPDPLLIASFGFFEAHDTFLKERLSPNFVLDRDVDTLLKVMRSHFRGRASASAVHLRAKRALTSMKRLTSRLSTQQLELHKKAVLAAEAIQSAQSEEDLEQLSLQLNEAWSSLEAQVMATGSNAYEIPTIGRSLAKLQERHDDDTAERLKNEELPELLEKWDNRRDAWLLHPEHCHRLLELGNELLAELEEGVEAYPKGQENLWEVTKEVESFFGELQEHRLPVGKLSLTPYAREAHVALYLLQGTLPMYAGQSMSETLRSQADVVPPVLLSLANDLADYLAEPEPTILLRSLERVLEAHEVAQNTTVCKGCGERAPVTNSKCSNCGGSLGFEAVSS